MERDGWGGVGLVGGWQVTASVCFYAIFAATAFVRDAFGLSRTLVGLVVTTVLLGYTLGLFPMGALVDGYGARPPMLLGLVVAGLGVLGVAFAPTYPVLLGGLFVVGVAYATAMPATNRAILSVAPPGHRNLAMNVKQVGVTAGSGLSALLITGAATTRYGWRAGFVVAAVVAVAVAVLFWRFYPTTEGSGAVSVPDVRSLFVDRQYVALVAAGFFFGISVYTTTGYVVPHLTESVGTAAGFAGLVLASVQVTGSLGRLGGGAVADRLRGSDVRTNAVVLLAQGLGSAACFVGVAVVGSPLAAAVVFVALGVFILGFPGMYYGCMTGLVSDDRIGEATAAGQLVMNLGGLVSPPAFGYLADTLSYGASWLALAVASVVAAALAAWLALSS
jgi:predicted MFS family arabinose efflux permease